MIREDLGGLLGGNHLWQLALLSGSRLLPDFYFGRLRTQLFRWAGCDIALGSSFLGDVTVAGADDGAGRLHIGPGCIIGPGVKFDLEADIVLGKNVAIGPSCVLATSTHALGVGSRRMQTRVQAKPITIDDGAWIGIGSMVLAGVRIGHGAVVSAGSVVVHSVEANTLVSGNPATVVKQLPLGDR